jgi:zinc transporter ZupT
MPELIQWNAIIVIATLAGGLLPLVRRWSERALHLFVAFAAGVFMGAVFLHLLPSIVALFAIEQLAFRTRAADSHDVLGHATFVGLAVHSLAGGFGLASGGGTREVQLAIFLSILGHKTAEAFSLATVLLLGGRTPMQVMGRVGLLAMMTPLGCAIGSIALRILPDGTPLAPTAIATGTFLYVALLDLLPEVLHQRQDLAKKILLMLAGLGLMALLRGAH